MKHFASLSGVCVSFFVVLVLPLIQSRKKKEEKSVSGCVGEVVGVP